MVSFLLRRKGRAGVEGEVRVCVLGARVPLCVCVCVYVLVCFGFGSGAGSGGLGGVGGPLVCSGENKQRLGFMLWDFWIGRAMRRALCVFAGLIY